jgi:hypothetical protein
MKRPTVNGPNGSVVTTPSASTLIQLLGSSFVFHGNAFTNDQYAALKRLYGFKKESKGVRPEIPPRPNQPEGYPFRPNDAYKEEKAAYDAAVNWSDDQAYRQAGADRNLTRHMEADGLRLVAWLAKFVLPGEDPLKTLIQLATDAGWDVEPSDEEWAEGCEEEVKDEL